MDISRNRQCTFRNDGTDTITVLVDHERFLVPPDGYLLTTGRGDIYLAFAGDAPMMAFPLEVARSDAAVERSQSIR